MAFSIIAISGLLCFVAGALWHRFRSHQRKEQAVGIFHPYTNDGGGGERVLWCAVRAIQQAAPHLRCVIYTGDDATPETLTARALNRFGVELCSQPMVVKLQKRKWVEASTYPHFTLLGQSLGSMVLGLEALINLTPSIFFDTSGYAFTYPLARLFGCKAHSLQIEAFAKVLKQINTDYLYEGKKKRSVRLKFVGSCRHKGDEDRVQKIKILCSDLGIQDQVDLHINVSYIELVELLGGAIAGLHAMLDEHFGIVVVEYMAAGAIPIAHNSAGPKMDIVLEQDGQRTGFLAESVDQYADAMIRVLRMSEEERLQIAAAARKRAMYFSEDRFDQDFKAAVSCIL